MENGTESTFCLFPLLATLNQGRCYAKLPRIRTVSYVKWDDLVCFKSLIPKISVTGVLQLEPKTFHVA